MPHFNVEIKARCDDHNKIRKILLANDADFKGMDHQVDTYFNVGTGRLKLREGNIENHLIFYEREDKEGPKQSKVTFFENKLGSPLKEILTKSLGILAVVDKKREIYFIKNVKFHIDTVDKLGTFMEIEAIDSDSTIGKDKLQEQCQHYVNLFGVAKDDLLSKSYSDMLI